MKDLLRGSSGLWQRVCKESETVKFVLENGLSYTKKSTVNLLMIHLRKIGVFIKIICLMKRISFFKWKLLPGLAGIGTWLEHINTPSGTGAKSSGCHNLFLCGVRERLMFPEPFPRLLWGYGFTPSLVKESHRIYILLILNFGLRVVSSLRPGSTPFLLLPLTLNL